MDRCSGVVKNFSAFFQKKLDFLKYEIYNYKSGCFQISVFGGPVVQKYVHRTEGSYERFLEQAQAY
jgi:hypothetical protein